MLQIRLRATKSLRLISGNSQIQNCYFMFFVCIYWFYKTLWHLFGQYLAKHFLKFNFSGQVPLESLEEQLLGQMKGQLNQCTMRK